MPILHRRRVLRRRLLLLVALAAATPCAARAQGADSLVVAAARDFMEAYARDLRMGDREAIAARYDRRGAWLIFNGTRDFSAWDSIAAQYRTRWNAPAAFEWRDLVYVPAGPGTVVVNGRFLWTPEAGAEPMRFTYTALLVRQDGELRIRLEDESVLPPSPPAPPPVP